MMKQPKPEDASRANQAALGQAYERHSAISSERLRALKELFGKRGVTLTDAEALEIGLWLLSKTRAAFRPIPLDKMGLFVTIKRELTTFRRTTRFVNLHQWRRNKPKQNKTSANN